VNTQPGGSLRAHFATLPDPRVERTKRHGLLDLVTIAVCAVVCGADSWVAVEQFGQRKEAFLRRFLALPHGIPSHDTFGRVFAVLDPARFEACFLAWIQDTVRLTGGQVVAIDGKTARRSHDRGGGKAALHLVSAWATANRVVLGQVAVDAKSNEITAIPALLEVLAISGCIVTIDALGCQTAIARTIRAREADYVLALKPNHPRLHADVAGVFADALGANLGGYGVGRARTVEKDHGRLEVRRCAVLRDPAVIAWLDPTGDWTNLRAIALVESERRIGDTTTVDRRYYLTSLDADADAARLLAAVRGHWGIENELHWVLDVAFREDECRVRQGHAAENLAVVRHIALNLLRRETTAKVGVPTKRLMAGWDETYLLKILAS